MRAASECALHVWVPWFWAFDIAYRITSVLILIFIDIILYATCMSNARRNRLTVILNIAMTLYNVTLHGLVALMGGAPFLRTWYINLLFPRLQSLMVVLLPLSDCTSMTWSCRDWTHPSTRWCRLCSQPSRMSKSWKTNWRPCRRSSMLLDSWLQKAWLWVILVSQDFAQFFVTCRVTLVLQ